MLLAKVVFSICREQKREGNDGDELGGLPGRRAMPTGEMPRSGTGPPAPGDIGDLIERQVAGQQWPSGTDREHLQYPPSMPRLEGEEEGYGYRKKEGKDSGPWKARQRMMRPGGGGRRIP